MSPWTRWGLKLLMALLALSGFAAGADQIAGPGSERRVQADLLSPGAVWQALAQPMNPPLAATALLLADASDAGVSGLSGLPPQRAGDEATQPCESSAGLLLLACLLAPLWRRRRARHPA